MSSESRRPCSMKSMSLMTSSTPSPSRSTKNRASLISCSVSVVIRLLVLNEVRADEYRRLAVEEIGQDIDRRIEGMHADIRQVRVAADLPHQPRREQPFRRLAKREQEL